MSAFRQASLVADAAAAAQRRRTRILLVIAGLPAGGAERQMALLAAGLDRARYDVGLLIFNAVEKVHYREVFASPLWFRALSLSRSQGWSLIARLMKGVADAVREFRPDIVHSSLNVANHAVRLSSVLFHWRTPVISSVRADFRVGYSKTERLLERTLWRVSSHVICNSEKTRQQLLEDLKISPARISTISNGIDRRFFSDSVEELPVWWPPGRVGLVVGRYKTEKNHLGLTSALGELQRRGSLGEWRFVFLGEGPLQEELSAALARENLTGKIVLAAPVADVAPLYRASQLLILPSRFEGMPNAALEAQAGGCPVAISAAANGSGVVNRAAGWILDEDLVKDLESILTLPPSRFTEIGRAARQYVAGKYSLEAMIAGTEAVYEKVLGRPHVTHAPS